MGLIKRLLILPFSNVQRERERLLESMEERNKEIYHRFTNNGIALSFLSLFFFFFWLLFLLLKCFLIILEKEGKRDTALA